MVEYRGVHVNVPNTLNCNNVLTSGPILTKILLECLLYILQHCVNFHTIRPTVDKMAALFVKQRKNRRAEISMD